MSHCPLFSRAVGCFWQLGVFPVAAAHLLQQFCAPQQFCLSVGVMGRMGAVWRSAVGHTQLRGPLVWGTDSLAAPAVPPAVLLWR